MSEIERDSDGKPVTAVAGKRKPQDIRLWHPMLQTDAQMRDIQSQIGMVAQVCRRERGDDKRVSREDMKRAYAAVAEYITPSVLPESLEHAVAMYLQELRREAVARRVASGKPAYRKRGTQTEQRSTTKPASPPKPQKPQKPQKRGTKIGTGKAKRVVTVHRLADYPMLDDPFEDSTIAVFDELMDQLREVQVGETYVIELNRPGAVRMVWDLLPDVARALKWKEIASMEGGASSFEASSQGLLVYLRRRG